MRTSISQMTIYLPQFQICHNIMLSILMNITWKCYLQTKSGQSLEKKPKQYQEAVSTWACGSYMLWQASLVQSSSLFIHTMEETMFVAICIVNCNQGPLLHQLQKLILHKFMESCGQEQMANSSQRKRGDPITLWLAYLESLHNRHH